MNPKPLVGIAADPGLEHIVAFLGGSKNVGRRMSSFGEMYLAAKVENVLSFGRLPQHKARQDGRAGFECDAREARGGTGIDPEEFYEFALRRRHVGVHEDADSPAFVHGG